VAIDQMVRRGGEQRVQAYDTGHPRQVVELGNVTFDPGRAPGVV
jgi:hypothetical protein